MQQAYPIQQSESSCRATSIRAAGGAYFVRRRFQKPPTALARLTQPKQRKMNKTTLCLWYTNNAEEAARFYAKTFPNSTVGKVHRAPSDYPSGGGGGKQGSVLTFTVCGIPCIGLTDAFKHSKAFAFQIAADDQTDNEADTDRDCNALVNNCGKRQPLSSPTRTR